MNVHSSSSSSEDSHTDNNYYYSNYKGTPHTMISSMLTTIIVATAALLSTVALADTRIQFLNSGNGNVLTSLVGQAYNDGDVNTIFTEPTYPYDKGMQVLYKQLVTDQSLAPLVTVYLVNADIGFQATLIQSFNTIGQTCACYWLDAKSLLSLYPNLATSNRYQLWFKSEVASAVDAMDLKSGYFGINIGASPKTAPVITSQKINNSPDIDYDAIFGNGGKSSTKSVSGAAEQFGGVARQPTTYLMWSAAMLAVLFVNY